MSRYILTSKTKKFFFRRPEDHPFDIEEIAHSLSQTCRYTGHCKDFYSVAQHSVLVSMYVPQEHAISGLLHDASEAYLGDVSSPLKSMLPEYKAIEEAVEKEICKQYHLPWPHPPIVKYVDLRALVTEAHYLFDKFEDERDMWPDVPPLHVGEGMFYPLPPKVAKELFLQRWTFLTQS